MATRVFVVCTLAIAACACGDDKTAPSPTVAGIVVTSTSDLLFIGANETFTATATLSDDTTRTITNGVWGTNDPQIVSVEQATGRVLAIGSGNATVFVDYEGQRGTRAIRALPNFQGAWSGSYVVRTCTETGEIAEAELCSDVFVVGSELPLNLIASQTRDVATAQLFLGSLLGNVDGTVQLNGEWPASGTIRSGEVSIETVWVFQSAQSGRITGSGNFLIRADGVSGELRMEVEMVNLVRGGATDLAGRAGNDRPVRTIRDLKAALLRRR